MYTAELTAIAGRNLRATTLVNCDLDRNHIDLNRFSDVSARAPWFGELVAEVLEAVVRRHGFADVLFLHGWHTGQPRCDIGVGGVQIDGDLHLVNGAGLTVPEADLDARLHRVQSALQSRGIHTSVGERYPASHRNNLLQVFSERGLERQATWARSIARRCSSGQVAAMQLELGAPLRWPGRWRDRLVDGMREAFASVPPAAGARRKIVVRRGTTPSPEARAFARTDDVHPVDLQFYDPSACVGGVLSVGAVGPGRIGGRLLLFLGGQRIALFTGEARSGNGREVLPLQVRGLAGKLECTFDGPVLCLDDAARYLDLEAALARSDLQDAEVRLTCTTVDAGAGAGAEGPQLGCVEGTLRLGAQLRRVQTRGLLGSRPLRNASRPGLMVAADLGSEVVVVRADEARGSALGVRLAPSGNEALSGLHLSATRDGEGDPLRIELRQPGQPCLHATPRSRMNILRPAGPDCYLRVSFGIAECRKGKLHGHAFYESVTTVGARPAGPV